MTRLLERAAAFFGQGIHHGLFEPARDIRPDAALKIAAAQGY